MDMEENEEAPRESTPPSSVAPATAQPGAGTERASTAAPANAGERSATGSHGAPSELHREAKSEAASGSPKEAQREATHRDKGERGGDKPPTRTKRIKNNVRKIRTERMMSKAELARRAGMSTLTIDRVERGLPCRMDTKRKILEALGLKPSDRLMVFGEED